jgi:hypothetical protein
MVIWEVFDHDEERGWLRVQKGTLYDTDQDSDSQVHHKVFQAAWKGTSMKPLPHGWM